MSLVIAPAEKPDAAGLAVLCDIAGHGLPSWLWHAAKVRDGYYSVMEVGRERVLSDEHALSHRRMIAAKAMSNLARTVSHIQLKDGVRGEVSLVRGIDPHVDRNPLGDLNAGIIDVIDHGDRVGIRLRLVGHDGHGRPTTMFDSGELGRRVDPDRRVTGIA